MGEIQARRAIRQFVDNYPAGRVLAGRVETAVKGDLVATAGILAAVEDLLASDETGQPWQRKERKPATRQPLVTHQSNPAREVKRKVKRAAQTFNNPGKALDKWAAKKGQQVKRKAGVWARDHLAKPVVAAALRLVGMEMKK